MATDQRRMISVKPDWSLAEEPPAQIARNPYDPKTWGTGCGRGIAYMQIGAEVASGTKGVIRKITGGRKGKGK